VSVGEGVKVWVGDDVGVELEVGLEVGVALGVTVAVAVLVSVGVRVAVADGAAVAEAVGVEVGVGGRGVKLAVGLADAVAVGVSVAVGVALAKIVAVAPGAALSLAGLACVLVWPGVETRAEFAEDCTVASASTADGLLSAVTTVCAKLSSVELTVGGETLVCAASLIKVATSTSVVGGLGRTIGVRSTKVVGAKV
jgi:hypothetical protein